MSSGQMGFRPNEISAIWVSAKRGFGQTSFGQTRLARYRTAKAVIHERKLTAFSVPVPANPLLVAPPGNFSSNVLIN
jgi:hypothetical protein